MFMLECQSCHAKAFTADARSPDVQLQCACCPLDHDHGKAAEKSTPCRPLTIHLLPGSASLSVM